MKHSFEPEPTRIIDRVMWITLSLYLAALAVGIVIVWGWEINQ